MSPQEQQTANPSHQHETAPRSEARPESRSEGRSEVRHASSRRKLDDFDLDQNVIDELTGRKKVGLRGLTPIKGLSGEPFDPIVETALKYLQDKYAKGLRNKRAQLAEKHFEIAEAVAARLNRKSLPRTTRLLLSTEGVFETLLLEAIENRVGWQSEWPEAAADDSHSGRKQRPPVAGV